MVSEKSVAQKLLIKPNQKILIANPPIDYRALLGNLPEGVIIGSNGAEPVDIIIY